MVCEKAINSLRSFHSPTSHPYTQALTYANNYFPGKIVDCFLEIRYSTPVIVAGFYVAPLLLHGDDKWKRTTFASALAEPLSAFLVRADIPKTVNYSLSIKIGGLVMDDSINASQAATRLHHCKL